MKAYFVLTLPIVPTFCTAQYRFQTITQVDENWLVTTTQIYANMSSSRILEMVKQLDQK